MPRDLPLHKDKGVNPRVTCCSNCGKDVGLVLLGAHDRMYECRCGAKLIGTKKCPHCNATGHCNDLGPVPEHEKLGIELCDDCEKAIKACNEEVKKGGVFWRCTLCGASGAFSAGSEIAPAIREKMGVEPPKACGVEYNDNCPVCIKKGEA